MKKYDLVSYAADFVSFLIKNIDMSNIKNVILFGSVSRLDADKDSDIDIFIDIIMKGKYLEKEIANAKQGFFDSVKYRNYWKLLGIQNDINVIVGRLEDWDLENSVISTGINLYGKYYKKPSSGRDMILFVWENVKPGSKRALLNKNIFGYKKGKKFYSGLIQKYECLRLGKGCILVNSEFYNQFAQLFKKLKIPVKIRMVFDYS